MEVHALQLHTAPVEVESVRRTVVRIVRNRESDLAYAEAHPFARNVRTAAIRKRHLGFIQRRVVHIPQVRLLDGKERHAAHSRLGRLGYGASLADYAHGYARVLRRALRLPRHLHERPVAPNLRRRHEDAVMGEVSPFAQPQRHAPVEASAGVPPRCKMKRGEAHRKRIPAGAHERRGVHTETRIAVVPAPRLLSVHIHFGRRHRPVEIKERALPCGRFRNVERKPVPADAFPRQTPSHAGRLVPQERPGYRPVVRHADSLPSRIVKRLGRPVRDLRDIPGEPPPFRKRNIAFAACAARGKHRQHGERLHLVHFSSPDAVSRANRPRCPAGGHS